MLNQTMRLGDGKSLMIEQPNFSKMPSVVTPILVNKKRKPRLGMPDHDFSPNNKIGSHRVSFLDLNGNLQNGANRNRRGISLNLDEEFSNKQRLFPPFIPDDPEKPHLTSRKKEKQRHLIIR